MDPLVQLVFAVRQVLLEVAQVGRVHLARKVLVVILVLLGLKAWTDLTVLLVREGLLVFLADLVFLEPLDTKAYQVIKDKKVRVVKWVSQDQLVRLVLWGPRVHKVLEEYQAKKVYR